MKIQVIVTHHFEWRFRIHYSICCLKDTIKTLKKRILNGRFYRNWKWTYVVIGKYRYFFKINWDKIILITMYKIKLSQLINKYMTDDYSYKIKI